MGSRVVRVSAALLLAACHNEPVAPATPPSGLTVSMRALSEEEALAAGPPPYAFVRGDSIVALAVINSPDCPPVVASAGFTGDELVLTMTKRAQDAPAICNAAAIPKTLRNVIRGMPTRAFYPLVIRSRFEGIGQAPQERQIARMTIYR